MKWNKRWNGINIILNNCRLCTEQNFFQGIGYNYITFFFFLIKKKNRDTPLSAACYFVGCLSSGVRYFD